MGRVIIVGSINQDITVNVHRFPEPGETLSGKSVHYRLGGKGSNQSAAAAHGGVETHFIGRVGNDPNGPSLRDELASHGVDVSALLIDSTTTTGIAFINVADSGENTIILDAGANWKITSQQARDAVDLTDQDIVVLQGEIPPTVNEEIIAWAHESDARVVLNLAPVYDIAPQVLSTVDVLVVNESEAGLVLGTPAPRDRDSAVTAARELVDLGITHALITLGKNGSVWAGPEGAELVDALDFGPVVDTTGAGDASVGVLAAALAKGHDFPTAVREGMRAGSTAVLSAGAAASYHAITPVPDVK
ncbi:ribokinase [Schaalia sp. ZJ1691]|uniref:ribokinase n=1 Tax=Schaalia sp. ZJ1691 TaxID=2709404 RepID=UPI0013EDEA9D|nr:ribokinase [Schaalia sp. ZJ1691]